MLKLFVDTNILLDIAFERKEYLAASQQIFSLIESGKAEGYVSALTCANVHYLIKKQASSRVADAFIRDLIRIVQVVEISSATIEKALGQESDFEDHIQSACAQQVKANYIVTRNVKDFKKSQVPALTAVQLLLII